MSARAASRPNPSSASAPAGRPAAPSPERPVPAPSTGWTITRALILAGFAAAFMAGVLEFHGDLLAFMVQGGVIMAPALAFCVWMIIQPKAWVQLVAGITVCLLPLLVLFVFGAALGLGNPTYGYSSVSLYLLTMAMALALPAGIIGFNKTRKNRPQAMLAGGWRSAEGIFAVAATFLFVGVIATSGLASVAVRDLASKSAGFDFEVDESATVEVKHHVFVPENVEVKLGVMTKIVVKNSDSAFHTLTYKSGNTTYDHPLLGGSTIEFLVLFKTAGTFQYWCAPHSSGEPGSKVGMIGNFTVTA
jgi:plastocyanin